MYSVISCTDVQDFAYDPRGSVPIVYEGSGDLDLGSNRLSYGRGFGKADGHGGGTKRVASIGERECKRRNKTKYWKFGTIGRKPKYKRKQKARLGEERFQECSLGKRDCKF